MQQPPTYVYCNNSNNGEYEMVNVVQVFAQRIEKDKNTIRANFDEVRAKLQQEYESRLAAVNNEEARTISVLDANYLQFISLDPCLVMKQLQEQQQQKTIMAEENSNGKKDTGVFSWLWSFVV